MNSKVNFVIICLVVMFGSCTRKGDSNKVTVDSVALKSKLTDNNLNGTFEYSQPTEQGFIHMTIETNKRGDSLEGKFLGGIYLKKSDTGEYSGPSVLAECNLIGIIKKGKIIEMQMKVVKIDRMKKEAPDFLGMMNLSREVSTVWIFSLDNGTLVSQNGTLDGGTLVKHVWKKIK